LTVRRGKKKSAANSPNSFVCDHNDGAEQKQAFCYKTKPSRSNNMKYFKKTRNGTERKKERTTERGGGEREKERGRE